MSLICPGIVTCPSGDKLRELLEKHGDFKQVELEITKWNKVTNKQGKQGRWVTKAYLMDVEKYTKTLYLNH